MPHRVPPSQRLSPTNDIVFKALFRDDEELLIGLLSAVLPHEPRIVSATVTNPELPRSSLDDKGVILDIKAVLDDGRLVNIEMQATREKPIFERLLYYWARTYGSQLQAGEGYEKLQSCYGVYFFDFELADSSHFHGHYELREERSGRIFSKALQLHTIELPRLHAEIRAAERLPESEATLARWARYISSSDANEIEELTMNDPLIEKAEEKLQTLSSDARLRQMAEDRERDRLAYRHTLAATRDEGREEGREEGRQLLLKKLLRVKFGNLPDAAVVRLAAARPDELDRWAEQLMTASSLDDVFA